MSERNTTNMTMTEIRRFMDAKRKREAKTRENLKRIGKAAAREAKRKTNWQKLIDEVLEEGMDLVWNEKTEKYEKKDEVCT